MRSHFSTMTEESALLPAAASHKYALSSKHYDYLCAQAKQFTKPNNSRLHNPSPTSSCIDLTLTVVKSLARKKTLIGSSVTWHWEQWEQSYLLLRGYSG